MKSNKKILKCSFNFLKLIGTTVLLSIFAYWGFEATQKFISKPVSSSVAFTNGDDNKGNFNLPAITICLHNYEDFMKYRVNKAGKCGSLTSHTIYFELLKKCQKVPQKDKTTSTTSTTTEDSSYFGGFFETESPPVEFFDTMKETLEILHLEINDTIQFFDVGEKKIKMGGGVHLTRDHRIELLQELWIPTYDMNRGQCFTFDPFRNNLTLIEEDENWMSIEFLFHLYPTDEVWRPKPKYYVVLHDRFEERFDAHRRNPAFIIYKGMYYNLKISKTVMETLNRKNEKCFEEQFYGIEKCKYLSGGTKFIEKYNCSLPWMSQFEFGNHTLCESDSVPNMDVIDLILESEMLYENAKNECKNYLPCKRSMYQALFEQEEAPMGTESTTLLIQYSSPYIQVIKDSWSYDLQSYIGEVGGTLGLLLGLSFASVFDFLEHLINSL